jgi:7-keto-8-aminopelargonate synthetase-like enzyme
VSASRIVSGERPIHQQLERAIANFLGTEDCIVYIGGHPTNVSTIGHLFGKNDLIVCDALNHNSIQLGCALSGATVVPFPHNDVQALESILQDRRCEFEKTLIAVEGVYSTDGDIAPLPSIVELKQRYKAVLMVDEAHSIGVIGETGRGIREYFGLKPTDVELWMGTLSKSFASCGGYIATSSSLVEYLKYTSPGFVYSVGMPPSNAASALAALHKIKAEPERIALLKSRTDLFLALAKEKGFDTGNSQDTPIIPVIIGDPYQAVQLSQRMMQRGINVHPMVYPSVAYDAARLRFFLSCIHSEDQICQTIAILAEEMAKLKGETTPATLDSPTSAAGKNEWLHYLMRSQFLSEKQTKPQQ